MAALLLDRTVETFPSHIEGFGFAVLEKLAVGVPTVAYNAPGLREMSRLTEAANLVPVGQPEVFASRTVDLLSSSFDAYANEARSAMDTAVRFGWE